MSALCETLISAGARVQSGQLEWAPTLAVAIAGVGVRDVFAYFLGRWLGGWLLGRGWTRRLLGGSRIDRAQALVARRGPSAVLIGRFFVGFRASVFMVAGATGVRFREFVLWDGLGLLVAVPATVALGYVFGAPLAELFVWALARARVIVGVSLALAVLWLIWTRWPRRADEG